MNDSHRDNKARCCTASAFKVSLSPPSAPLRVHSHPAALSYQAQEVVAVTVEWSFSSEADVSIPSLPVHCVSVLGLKVFYHLDGSVDESLHEQFAEQCDEEACSVECHGQAFSCMAPSGGDHEDGKLG